MLGLREADDAVCSTLQIGGPSFARFVVHRFSSFAILQMEGCLKGTISAGSSVTPGVECLLRWMSPSHYSAPQLGKFEPLRIPTDARSPSDQWSVFFRRSDQTILHGQIEALLSIHGLFRGGQIVRSRMSLELSIYLSVYTLYVYTNIYIYIYIYCSVVMYWESRGPTTPEAHSVWGNVNVYVCKCIVM